ncbi:Protein Wnt-4 [Hypsibius exemplaris]|uniref:Protein Wnt n=1 Tax=Hypsibius exemplaris TaxID=2072580 RepID=A0A1W0WXA1_HYPEX|nr:Protein Wnt-4 [Hypsibius exemplaris]
MPAVYGPSLSSQLIWLSLWITSAGQIAQSQAGLATWMYVGLAASSMHTQLNQQPATVTTSNWREARRANEIIHTLPNLDWCNNIPGLVDHQVALCKRNPEVFRQVTTAARMAIAECQNQFRLERWNCTTMNDSTVFGKTAIKGNRETAFIAAISSAAVVHSIVQACSSGNLAECGCDTRREGPLSADGFKWSGCSDNIEYGLEFSRLFNDAPEDIKRRDARSIRDVMHLHNKAAGRMIIQRNMKKQCRCHGVSGSCETKTCWMVMPKFYEVGKRLKRQYDHAVWVAKKSAVIKLKRRDRGTKSVRKPIKRIDLVFLEKSPNYCKSNQKRGILGTSGRQCNATSNGSDNCKQLCCGRGHIVRSIIKLDKALATMTQRKRMKNRESQPIS